MSRKNLSHDPLPQKNKRKNKSILSVERANFKKPGFIFWTNKGLHTIDVGTWWVLNTSKCMTRHTAKFAGEANFYSIMGSSCCIK